MKTKTRYSFPLLVMIAVSALVYFGFPPPQPAAAAEPRPLSFSTTWNPGSIADGDEAVTTITTSGGLAMGDFCLASFSLDVEDLAITCAVTTATEVTVQLLNNTGGAIDLASGTARVMVMRKQPTGG